MLGLDLRLGRWAVDLSQSAAANRLRYDLRNTLNPSLGNASPTAFEAGGLQLTQFVSNATLTRLFDKVLAGTNVALGGEFRTDAYRIFAGEEASCRDYERGQKGASGGSQGFIGFDPASAVAGTGRRRNAAAFLDVEADVTKRWTVGGAVRFENYSNFGSAFIYKANTRLRLARWLAARAGYNTGFRAPSQGQQVNSQLTLLPTAGGTTYSGIYNNQSPIARAAGLGGLRAETSRNLSAGLVLTPAKDLTLTADAYQIDIDDRISLTNVFSEGIAPSLAAGLLLAAGVQNVFNVRPDNVDTAVDNGHVPEGVPAPHNRNRQAANAYLSDKYGFNVSLPSDHDILPYQLVQMGSSGALYYLKASYSFGR